MTTRLNGELTLPGDKSISHRALMLLGISAGSGVVSNLSAGQDVMSTLKCMQTLGAAIDPVGENAYRVTGRHHLQSPRTQLDCGNSGTTIRLLAGLIAGAGIPAILTGDESLQKRPMKRVIEPLAQMRAEIQALGKNGCAPLQISPNREGKLGGIRYVLPMASAQVKSAVLLAGLFTDKDDPVVVVDPDCSRDHSERMLTALGATVERQGDEVKLIGRHHDMQGQDILVPGDISSAAFWLVGAAITPGSRVTIRQVGLNPSRTGVLAVLKMAGASYTVANEANSGGEPYGDITIEGQPLRGNITITHDLIPALIDEIPILTVLGLFTEGVMTIRGAEELKFKESDRLASMIGILRQLDVDVETYDDGFRFQGNPNRILPERAEWFETHHDHRLVMALEILNLRAPDPYGIHGREWAAISYPNFFNHLAMLKTGATEQIGSR